MFQRLGGRAENRDALEAIERWVRLRFALPDRCLVLVSEDASPVPGFPERDTLIRFWDADGNRYRLRIFKPARAVTRDDLPVAWLLPSLLDTGDPDCC